MVTPSAATLREYMYDWGKKGNGVPPVRVRWGNEKQGEDSSIPKARPVPGVQEPKPVDASTTEKPAAAAPATEPATTASGGGGSQGVQVAGVDPTAGKGTIYLPAPQPGSDVKPVKKVPETSSNTAPTSIPSGISPPTPSPLSLAPKPANPAQAKAGSKVFEDEQKAIRTEGSGLFDTRGFPLSEYANLIIERVKGNWLIPSNLRNSQGRTTVVFYIDRDGRFTNARIITSSGSSSLDLAALNAVIESNPFPPLPKGFPGDHVGAKFVFSYNEHQ
jgi:protein TonB